MILPVVLAWAPECPASVAAASAAGQTAPQAAEDRSAGGGRGVILVDGSGSMQGFFLAGQGAAGRSAVLASVYEELTRVLAAGGSSVEGKAFVTREGRTVRLPIASSAALRGRAFLRGGKFGSRTLLAENLRWALRTGYDQVWLVTDNIEDTRSRTRLMPELKHFYETVQGRETGVVDLVLVRLRFDGPLYDIDDKPYAQYRGPKALVIYGIRSRGADSIQAGLVSEELGRELSARNVASRRMRAKPVIVESEIIPEIIGTEGLAGVEAKARLRRVASSKETTPQLVSEHTWREREPIRGAFAVRFRSKLPHVVLRDVPLEATLTRNFELADFTSSGFSADVSPPVLEVLEPDASAPHIVSFDIPSGVKFDPSSSSFGHLAQTLRTMNSKPTGDFSGSVKVILKPVTKSVGLDEKVMKAWHGTRDPVALRLSDRGSQQRVFGLRQLFGRSLPKEISPARSSVAEITFKVRYPQWAILAVLVPLLAGMGLALGAGVLLARPMTFTLEPAGENAFMFYDGNRPVGRTGLGLGEDEAEIAEPDLDQPDTSRSVRAWRLMSKGEPVGSASEGAGGGASIRWTPARGWQAVAAAGYVLNQGLRRLRLRRLDTFTITKAEEGRTAGPGAEEGGRGRESMFGGSSSATDVELELDEIRLDGISSPSPGGGGQGGDADGGPEPGG